MIIKSGYLESSTCPFPIWTIFSFFDCHLYAALPHPFPPPFFQPLLDFPGFSQLCLASHVVPNSSLLAPANPCYSELSGSSYPQLSIPNVFGFFYSFYSSRTQDHYLQTLWLNHGLDMVVRLPKHGHQLPTQI